MIDETEAKGTKRLEFLAPGPVASAFMESNAFLRGLMGPVGSGKSVTCVVEMIRRAFQQKPDAQGRRRTRWAVVRNTTPELRTTTMNTFFDWVPKEQGKFKSEGPPTFWFRADGVDAEFIFLALDRDDDLRKLMSLELTGIWFNEARYLSKAVLDAATSRVGRFPAKRDGGPTWTGVLLDTNPPDNESWWYKFAEEEPVDTWEFYKQPGGLTAGAENVHNLPGGAEYYQKMVPGKDADWIKVYINGDYGILMEGKPIFPEYKDSTHCGTPELIPARELVIGMDFGLTPAAVFLQQDARGRWLCHRELVCEDMGAERFAQVIKTELAQNFAGCPITLWGDPAGAQRSQADEKTVFGVLAAAGLPVRPAPSNTNLIRLEAVKTTLNRMIDGSPGFLIHQQCKTLRKALAGGYCYRKLKISGSARYAETPDKNEFSHIADALQYALLGGGEGRTVLHNPTAHAQRRPETYGADYDPLG